jgi:hypothetical protein
MRTVTPDICARLNGIGSISQMFPLLDSFDNSRRGGRGEGLSRPESAQEQGGTRALSEALGGCSPALRPLPSSPSCGVGASELE